MFYKMITKARDRWYEKSDDCTVSTLIDYIVRTDKMRDAQVDAIKTYLYLKIACENKPLSDLFISGCFNSLDLDEIPIKENLRTYLKEHHEAAALYEYATLMDDSGKQVSKGLEDRIKRDSGSLDYKKIFADLFYGVSYTDYLFSLPMGAGKTYLMASFIYLDLYFAINEPENDSFAHNFIILAPSGTKSSVVPSLRTILDFDPSWILPEPAASKVKQEMSFEVLDQKKPSEKSNKIKNPNVQKIARYQPFSNLFGLVVVTNAEKVILDCIDTSKDEWQTNIFGTDCGDNRERLANELRSILGKIPSVSVFIDEVHHAVSDEIKLRAVVNHWAGDGRVNSVIGFSGTPYLEKKEKVVIDDELSIGAAEISNVVYFYPLIKGIGNFLKVPRIQIYEGTDSENIISNGVREFLNIYKGTVYEGGLTAKLAIYCGSIAMLEDNVYPLVRRISAEYELDDSSILRFYREPKKIGDRTYAPPADSQMLFDTLDSNRSPIRIILLVQIGKEGWDCRSLAGIILSQKGDCPLNMVLQTSCRCLRQIKRGEIETALICLNPSNADKLRAQLDQEQHITLDEFQDGNAGEVFLDRYDRTGHLGLPDTNFFQMTIQYDRITTVCPNFAIGIGKACEGARLADATVITTDIKMEQRETRIDDEEHGTKRATFHFWLYSIVKESFGTLSMGELGKYEDALRGVFDEITYYNKNGERYFSSKYDVRIVNANIRKAFCLRSDFNQREEYIPDTASLLNIANFSNRISTTKPDDYFPDKETVKNVISSDDGGQISEDVRDALTIADVIASVKMDNELATICRKKYSPILQKDRSFHYLPYKTDSALERTFLADVLADDLLAELDLEIYYNGDSSMTNFRIRCYKKVRSKWVYIGLYTPDFLVIRRKDGNIQKAVIVETKGEIYANDPGFNDRRSFVESEFIPKNNEKFGYKKFDYLYLEDTLSDTERISQTRHKINEFFRGV